MNDYASLIAQWPRPFIRTFADDVGVAYLTAQMWRQRNSIPPEYWDLVVSAAAKRGIRVTMDDLQRLAAKRRKVRVGNDQAAVAA